MWESTFADLSSLVGGRFVSCLLQCVFLDDTNLRAISPSLVLKCKCWSSPMWIKPRCESTFCHFSSRGDADFKLFVKLHSAAATVLISCNAANQKMIKMMMMIMIKMMMMIEMMIIPLFWLWLESIKKREKSMSIGRPGKRPMICLLSMLAYFANNASSSDNDLAKYFDF